MNALTQTTADFSVARERPADIAQVNALKVTEAYWGYIVAAGGDRFDHETLGEMGMRFIGVIFVLMAYAHWLLPGSLVSLDVLTMKLVMSAFFASAGALFYWYASKGLHLEVQIDTTRREIRVANRNFRGRTRLQSRVAMFEIESAFIQRSKDTMGPAHLFLRRRNSPELVHIATANESELSVLHARLSKDLQPVEDRVEEKMAKRHALFATRRQMA